MGSFPLVNVGRQVRDVIIPPGYYWIDSFEATSTQQQASREAYLNVFGDSIRVITTEHVAANQGGPAFDWILFQVVKEVPRWPVETGWGFPTVAPKGAATTRLDTVQRPPPEPDFLDTIATQGIPTWVWVAGIGVGGLVLYSTLRR